MPFKSTLFPLVALASTALAVTNHVIVVGPALTYSPNNTIAAVGDTLTFMYYGKNHDVAQGDFSTPCAPLAGGFYSGFIMPETGAAEAKTKFVITVNNTDPIWFFCSAPRHCQGGMVAGVNLPSTDKESFELYKAASKATTESKTPAVVFGGRVVANEAASNETSSSSSTLVVASPTAASSSPSATTSNSAANSMGFQGLAVTFAGLLFGAGMM